GGAKINIDGDYLDSATAAAGTGSGVDTAPAPAPAPSLRVTTGPDGTTNLTPTWSGATGVVSWQLMGGSSPTSLTWAGPSVAAGGGLAYFKLSSTAQKALQHAHGHQLAVNVTVRSATGAKVTRTLTLSSFTTHNPGPARSGAQASQLKLIGTTEFVSHG